MTGSELSKHVQTIAVSLATMAIGFLAYSVQQTNVQIAVLVVKVDQLEHKVFTAAYATALPTRSIPAAPEYPLHDYRAIPVGLPEHRRK